MFCIPLYEHQRHEVVEAHQLTSPEYLSTRAVAESRGQQHPHALRLPARAQASMLSTCTYCNGEVFKHKSTMHMCKRTGETLSDGCMQRTAALLSKKAKVKAVQTAKEAPKSLKCQCGCAVSGSGTSEEGRRCEKHNTIPLDRIAFSADGSCDACRLTHAKCHKCWCFVDISTGPCFICVQSGLKAADSGRPAFPPNHNPDAKTRRCTDHARIHSQERKASRKRRQEQRLTQPGEYMAASCRWTSYNPATQERLAAAFGAHAAIYHGRPGGLTAPRGAMANIAVTAGWWGAGGLKDLREVYRYWCWKELYKKRQ